MGRRTETVGGRRANGVVAIRCEEFQGRQKLDLTGERGRRRMGMAYSRNEHGGSGRRKVREDEGMEGDGGT